MPSKHLSPACAYIIQFVIRSDVDVDATIPSRAGYVAETSLVFCLPFRRLYSKYYESTFVIIILEKSSTDSAVCVG